jgi:membrane protease YdiL (CAAX protease family)
MNPLTSAFIYRGRLHPLWRAILYVLGYFLSLFVVQVPIALIWIVPNLVQRRPMEEVAAVLETEILSLGWLLPMSLLQLCAVVGLTYLFRRFLDRASLRSLGFGTTGGWATETLLGLGLGLAAMGLVFAVEWGTGWAIVDIAPARSSSVGRILGAYLVMYAAVGFAEELMFRGYLLQTLQEWPGTLGAVAVSSLVFGIFHALNPNVSPLALVHLLLAGLVFAYAYLITRRLWLPIALHISWNYAQGPVFGFPVSGLASEGLFNVEPVAPVLITGGSFGPEGGLIGLMALVLIALILWIWAQSKSRSAVWAAPPEP